MRLLFNNTKIQNAINKIATEIYNKHYNDPEPPVMICVLNGAFMFFTDLVRALNIECVIEFIQLNSNNDVIHNIKSDLNRKNVYIIDDILDSGDTMKNIMLFIGSRYKPKTITPIVLLKNSKTEWPMTYGIEISDSEYNLCGFGMNSKNGLFRNKDFIFGEIKEIE
jgi:hypoxanthine phosphoribosyltransferase